MNHNIKRNRVAKSHEMKGYARTSDAIMDAIPAELYDTLTSRQITVVANALNAHWHKACAWKEQDILSEGAIYDPRIGKMRDIAA